MRSIDYCDPLWDLKYFRGSIHNVADKAINISHANSFNDKGKTPKSEVTQGV